jgi:hypothetical protein
VRAAALLGSGLVLALTCTAPAHLPAHADDVAAAVSKLPGGRPMQMAFEILTSSGATAE